MVIDSIFSDFEVKQVGVKVSADPTHTLLEWIGSVEEELNIRSITKKRRGIVVKEIDKGDGTGNLKITGHIPYGLFTQMFGMDLNNLITGVKAYGQNSVHPEFSTTLDTYDEDGVEKLRAYPVCKMAKGVARKVENGAGEVAEVDMEINVFPDAYGNCLYEALASGLSVTKGEWLASFTPTLVLQTVALTQTLANVTSSVSGGTAVKGYDFVAVYSVGTGYDLPDSITVTIGGEAAVSGTDYIYNAITGALIVYEVSDALVITVTGEAEA